MDTSHLVTIRESSIQQPATLRVDRDAGIIRDVKILGFESRNCGKAIGLDRAEFGRAVDEPYSYCRESAAEIAPSYEGKPVNIDHNSTEGDRSVSSVFGQTHGVHVRPDGIYASELRYVKSHPMAEQVLELAERFPTRIGLSHIAAGEPQLVEGRVVITHWEPECSDLVATPATTKGLFESEKKPSGKRRRMKKLTVREVIAAAKDATLTAALKEMDSEDAFAEVGDVPLDMPVDAAPDDQLKSAILEMLTAKMAEASTDELKKLLKALGVEDSLSSLIGGGEPEPEPEPDPVDEPAEDEESETMESLRRENRTLKARSLLVESGRAATDVRVAAMVAVKDTSHAALVESWPKDLLPQGNNGKRPLSSPPDSGNGSGSIDEDFDRLKKKYLPAGAN